MRKIILFTFMAFIALMVLNTFWNLKLERSIKSIKIGKTKEFVSEILGEGKLLEKGVGEVTDSKCANSVDRIHYKGNSCFFVCPTFFENSITVSYEHNVVCNIHRYGL